MYPLGTWFVSGICVWIPCIKETMIIIIIIIIIVIVVVPFIELSLMCVTIKNDILKLGPMQYNIHVIKVPSLNNLHLFFRISGAFATKVAKTRLLDSLCL